MYAVIWYYGKGGGRWNRCSSATDLRCFHSSHNNGSNPWGPSVNAVSYRVFNILQYSVLLNKNIFVSKKNYQYLIVRVLIFDEFFVTLKKRRSIVYTFKNHTTKQHTFQPEIKKLNRIKIKRLYDCQKEKYPPSKTNG